MNRKFIPVEEVAKEWMKRPDFVAAYGALEDEFAMAAALIRARAEADIGLDCPKLQCQCGDDFEA